MYIQLVLEALGSGRLWVDVTYDSPIETEFRNVPCMRLVKPVEHGTNDHIGHDIRVQTLQWGYQVWALRVCLRGFWAVGGLWLCEWKFVLAVDLRQDQRGHRAVPDHHGAFVGA